MLFEITNTVFEKYQPLATQVLRNNDALVVYGYGNLGKQMVDIFIRQGFAIDAILDKHPALAGTSISCNGQNIPIYHPDDYTDIKKIIVICTYYDFLSITDYFKNRGFLQILPCFFYLFNHEITRVDASYLTYINWKRILSSSNSNGLIMNSLDVVITEKCTLRCIDCSNLTQYFLSPQHSNVEEMRCSLDRLFSVIDHCAEIHILGGEPFTNPDFYKYMDMLERYSHAFDWYIIFTNATIIPNKQTIDSMKNKQLLVLISDYGNSQQQCENLSQILIRAGIIHDLKKVSNWQDCGKIMNYSRTEKENTLMFQNCSAKNLFSLAHGKLFHCPYSASAFRLQAIPCDQHEYIDLLDKNIPDDKLKEQIAAFLNSFSLKICNYCGGRPLDGKIIPAARQVQKPLQYHRYEE